MSVSHLYHNFRNAAETPQDVPQPPTAAEVEDMNLAAFEEGYQAGWEDALKAQTDTGNKLTEDFIQNMQDMSFTYQEAFGKVTAGMKPVLSTIITKLLPQVAEESLVPQIIDQMMVLVARQRETLVEVVVSPEKRETVQELLEEQDTVPFNISEDSSLSSGQIYLRAGSVEREINLDQVLEGVTSAIDAFYHTAEQEKKYG